MTELSHEELIHLQSKLEDRLAEFADTELRHVTTRISADEGHAAAARYLTRPSKRLLGMAFLHTARTLNAPGSETDHIAIATALEIRHGAILLHDDIVDRDTHRGGQPTAHTALIPAFGTDEARSAALFLGDALAALAPLPLLRSALPATTRLKLTDIFTATTAQVAAGQTEQLHLDTAVAPEEVTEDDILRVHAGQFAPYLLCSLHLALALAGHRAVHRDRVTTDLSPMCQAYQVHNDLNGYQELTRVLATGDDHGAVLTLANTSDLARRRLTLLAHTAHRLAPPAHRERLRGFLHGDTDDALATITQLIADSRAPEHVARRILELHQQARVLIEGDTDLPAATRAALAATVQYMTDLYDPDTITSRLYLRARHDLHTAN
ncbi:polyprenyl synthetase family protein [Streptomyces sp. PTM05]|uniref:Polyprenyl synthetase family protein n=1 Tax=Streptantibioticus parmotrematis TaxID=2873249 RepID=A0ABS7R1F1_9ACTN|nr:polyprenyl synthetase family protein [Streptantibioticus parmotrematis]MBY8889298.1 polyprenyl synthetase family protein [Streptantibioticus parmotrematis]